MSEESIFYRKKQKKKRFIKRVFLVTFLINILCHLFVSYFYFPVKIKGNFYQPFYQQNQILWIKKVNFKENYKKLHRGDFVFIEASKKKRNWYSFLYYIIPFSFLHNNSYKKVTLQKVVAFPGEKIRISKKKIYINNELIEINFLNQGDDLIDEKIFNRDSMKESFVPNNYIVVINFNWQINNDSRKYGFLPIDDVVGIIPKKKLIK